MNAKSKNVSLYYCEGGVFLRFCFSLLMKVTRGVKGKVRFRVIGGWDRG